MELRRKVSLYNKKKNLNLLNYQGPDHSTYQALVFQSGAIRPSGHCVLQIPNIYLKLSLNPNGFDIFIIFDTFVSSPIRFMIPDMPLQKFLYPIKSVLGSHTCQAWEPLVYPPRGFYYFSHCPNIHRRQSWCLHKGEVLAASSRAFIHTIIKLSLRVIYLQPWWVGNLQKGSQTKSYISQ